MLQSTYHNKDTNEDPKTSYVFERMLMLPDELFCGVSRTNFFGISSAISNQDKIKLDIAKVRSKIDVIINSLVK